jgi:hypothetical protein
MPLRQRQEIQKLLRTLIVFEIAAFDICALTSLDFKNGSNPAIGQNDRRGKIARDGGALGGFEPERSAD